MDTCCWYTSVGRERSSSPTTPRVRWHGIRLRFSWFEMNLAFNTMAPVCALCLRCAAALWPKHHKSYTAVIRARNVLSIDIVLPIFWCLYCFSCLRFSWFRMTIASIRFTIIVIRNNHTGIPILSPLRGSILRRHIYATNLTPLWGYSVEIITTPFTSTTHPEHDPCCWFPCQEPTFISLGTAPIVRWCRAHLRLSWILMFIS